MAKRSFWAWGHESDEPTAEQMKTAAGEIAHRYNVDLTPVGPPNPADLSLRKPRITENRPQINGQEDRIHPEPKPLDSVANVKRTDWMMKQKMR